MNNLEKTSFFYEFFGEKPVVIRHICPFCGVKEIYIIPKSIDAEREATGREGWPCPVRCEGFKKSCKRETKVLNPDGTLKKIERYNTE